MNMPVTYKLYIKKLEKNIFRGNLEFYLLPNINVEC